MPIGKPGIDRSVFSQSNVSSTRKQRRMERLLGLRIVIDFETFDPCLRIVGTSHIEPEGFRRERVRVVVINEAFAHHVDPARPEPRSRTHAIKFGDGAAVAEDHSRNVLGTG